MVMKSSTKLDDDEVEDNDEVKKTNVKNYEEWSTKLKEILNILLMLKSCFQLASEPNLLLDDNVNKPIVERKSTCQGTSPKWFKYHRRKGVP